MSREIKFRCYGGIRPKIFYPKYSRKRKLRKTLDFIGIYDKLIK